VGIARPGNAGCSFEVRVSFANRHADGGVLFARTPDGVARPLQTCALCPEPFPYSQGRFAGRSVDEWGILICDACESMNQDGLDPGRHRELKKRMAAEGVKPESLPGGFIRIPPRGH
jgi:hypothetical protein